MSFYSSPFYELAFWFIIALLSRAQGEILELITLNTKLPSTRALMPVVYDGDDSIYIIGGQYGFRYWRDDILKFSVQDESIEEIGRDREGVAYMSGVWAGNETLLMIAGCHFDESWCYDEIWAFTPSNASYWTIVGRLPFWTFRITSAWNGKDTTYMIGGAYSNYQMEDFIFTFSTETNEFGNVAPLPSGRVSHSAAFDKNGNLFIFGGQTGLTSGFLNEIVKHVPSENTTVKLNSRLPTEIGFSCAVSVREYIYLIGGTTNTANQWPEIVRFNTETEEVVTVEARNFPEKLYAHGCAYVEKMNRIYIFGGYAEEAYRDQIMYISMDGEEATTTPEAPATTSTTAASTTTTEGIPVPPVDCVGQDEGTLLPNPYCCESYFQCINWEAVIQHCPSQLQFSPILKRCEYRGVVKCGIVYGN